MSERLVDRRIGGIRLLGYSLAGEETVIIAPELNVAFDIGRAPREVVAIDHICLSHGHMDHAAGIAYYFSQRAFLGNSPGAVIVHPELVEPVRNVIRAWAALEGHLSPHNVVGLEPGSDYEIRRNLVVRAFPVNHGPRCLGFAVIEKRHKLNPRYQGMTAQQIVALKRKGVEVNVHFEVPLIAYCGDTADGEFLDLDYVRNARILLIECTFIDREHVYRARAGRHLHLIDLPRILPRLRNPHVVLTHLTRRTGLREARRRIRELVEPGDLPRLTFLMERPRRRGEAARDRTPAQPPGDESTQDAESQSELARSPDPD